MIKTSMDISFIQRTLKTMGFLALIVLVFGIVYLDTGKALSIFSGMIWGMVNLYFLAYLIRVTIRPEGPDKTAALGLLFIKIPLLYLAGYFLISNEYFNLTYLVIGFSTLFAVILLKILGRVILGIDSNKTNDNNSPQEVI
jgi:hypothetical protein